MINLKIERTDITPEIILDASANEIIMTGECLPENAVDFFSPILEWLENRLEEKCQAPKLRRKEQLLQLFYSLFNHLPASGGNQHFDQQNHNQ